MIDRSLRNRTNVLIILGLVIGTFALYARTAHFGFINLDDGAYVYANKHTLAGINSDNIAWAFTTGELSNWHPLMWLSLMLDVSLFGSGAGPMHVVNVALHAVDAALLFVLLLTMTGARWPSAWVAAMFAWHPQHVESVAWISERKDVLSTLFMILCIFAYLRYVRAPSGRRFAWVCGWLAIGLLTKPMLVTLPCVLLLLDFWPLNRLSSLHDLKKLVVEKWPLLVIVLLSSIATYIAQLRGHAVVATPTFPIGARIVNSLNSYGVYLEKTIVPRGLAVFYPMQMGRAAAHLPFAGAAISAIVLLFFSACVLTLRKSHPWLLVGWLWYLGTLVPVIGLVQVGGQSHADRYTYVPLIGIFIGVAWEAQYLIRQRWIATVLGSATVLACLPVTWRQIGYWRNAETVMRHAVMVVPDNYHAHAMLGEAMDSRNDVSGAIDEYNRSIVIKPDDADALNNLALLMLKLGNEKEALRRYREAVFANPLYGPAYNNYGNLLMKQGRIDDAIKVYRAGIKQNQEVPQLYHNLALSLAQQGKIVEAIGLWQKALKLDPDYTDAQASLGTAQMMAGQPRDGITQLSAALKSQPDRIDALTTLAWTYATHPNPLYQNSTEAVRLARHAVDLTDSQDAVALDTLAASEARVGRFDDAIRDSQAALSIAQAQWKSDLVDQIQKRIKLYQSHQPFTSGQ